MNVFTYHSANGDIVVSRDIVANGLQVITLTQINKINAPVITLPESYMKEFVKMLNAIISTW